jgi:hypothetical protein
MRRFRDLFLGIDRPQSAWQLAAALEQGDIAIQPDETLMKELLAYRVERLAGGGYRYSAPPGLHDDTVIACALAWHGVKRFGSFSGAAALDRDDW